MEAMASRVDTSMTTEEIEEYLAAARTMILCTIGPDGIPDPVGMWFVIMDGDIWMRTYARSQKAVNIQRDPRVSVLVESGDSYATLRGVQISGVAHPSSDEDRICEIAAQLLVKYEGLDLEHVSAVREAYRAKAPKQVALRLEPLRTVSWGHRRLVPPS
jgi:PPOX class probable F420-dependent enzyme